METEDPAFVAAVLSVLGGLPQVIQRLTAEPGRRHVYAVCGVCGSSQWTHSEPQDGPGALSCGIDLCADCAGVQASHPDLFAWVGRVIGFHVALDHGRPRYERPTSALYQ